MSAQRHLLDQIGSAQHGAQLTLLPASGRWAEARRPRQAPEEADGATPHLLVLPGGVDTHCHIEEPQPDGSANEESFVSASAAAFAGGTTSVVIPDFKEPGKTLTLPLGLFAGISLGAEKPIVEIIPSFVWPKFAAPGATTGSFNKVNIDVFTASLAVRGYIYL